MVCAAKTRYRPTETIRQELTMSLTKRAMELKSLSDASARGAATAHIAGEVPASMTLEDIVTEMRAHSTDDARDVSKAAQAILNGKQQDIRNLCKPWGVQLTAEKRYRPTETMRQELKMSVTKRAMKLKSLTDASARGAAPRKRAASLKELFTTVAANCKYANATEHAACDNIAPERSQKGCFHQLAKLMDS